MSAVRSYYRDALGSVYDRVYRTVFRWPSELRKAIDYHLATMTKSKGLRPALCLALGGSIEAAAIVQMAHEATLIFDDILDQAKTRRGKRCVHLRYGRTVASAAGLKLMAEAQLEAARWPNQPNEWAKHLAYCSCDIAEAEALQWNLRYGKRPTDLEDWRRIARGDTGALFQLARRLADNWTPSQYDQIEALAYLYHGLDDVQDILEGGALGGGGCADVRDRIPTLLTCYTKGTDLQSLRTAAPEALDYLRTLFPEKIAPGLEPFFLDLMEWHNAAKKIAKVRGL